MTCRRRETRASPGRDGIGLEVGCKMGPGIASDRGKVLLSGKGAAGVRREGLRNKRHLPPIR